MGPKGTETKEVVLGHDKLANIDVLTHPTQDDRGRVKSDRFLDRVSQGFHVLQRLERDRLVLSEQCLDFFFHLYQDFLILEQMADQPKRRRDRIGL